MRTRLKQRIFKRFMAGETLSEIATSILVAKKKAITYDDIPAMRIEVEQAIRDCVMQIESRGK